MRSLVEGRVSGGVRRNLCDQSARKESGLGFRRKAGLRWMIEGEGRREGRKKEGGRRRKFGPDRGCDYGSGKEGTAPERVRRGAAPEREN